MRTVVGNSLAFSTNAKMRTSDKCIMHGMYLVYYGRTIADTGHGLRYGDGRVGKGGRRAAAPNPKHGAKGGNKGQQPSQSAKKHALHPCGGTLV